MQLDMVECDAPIVRQACQDYDMFRSRDHSLDKDGQSKATGGGILPTCM